LTDPAPEKLQRTALFDLHVEMGARMVPFAGYEMPVRFPGGIIAEHLHTRSRASLFDIGHMGQVTLRGGDVAEAIETVVPGDIQGLAPWAMRYTMLTNETGGILDDVIVIRADDHLTMVVNAACKAADLDHLRDRLAGRLEITSLEDRALLALQGPRAVEVLARFAPACRDMKFMTAQAMRIEGADCMVARAGYTGEDGFEISLANDEAPGLARLLLGEEEVMAAGLGARDTLRLEAGLCLYGHDIDTATTPVEARLGWTISKRRAEAGGFPGADIIRAQLVEGPKRRRVGIKPSGRAPARRMTEITDAEGRTIGEITSGGFGPTVGGPVAMGYVESGQAELATGVKLMVRGRARAGAVAALPFVPPRYYRG
jgi:aminomethyltransferase